MIRAVGNKRLDLSDEEYSYYNILTQTIDKSEFNGIFESDKNGIILNVMPDPQKNTSLIVYFFLMNVSFNQRLRKLSSFVDRVDSIDEIRERLSELENKILKI